MAMRSQRWKSPLERAGLLRRITTGWLRGAGLPADLYLPGDTVIVDPRRAIRPGEIVVAELAALPFPATNREGERTREPDPAGASSLRTGGRAVAERSVPPGAREAIFLHDPGAAAIRFISPNPGVVSLQVPASDLVVVGVVIGLRRAL
jgi:hypothetical protein